MHISSPAASAAPRLRPSDAPVARSDDSADEGRACLLARLRACLFELPYVRQTELESGSTKGIWDDDPRKGRYPNKVYRSLPE